MRKMLFVVFLGILSMGGGILARKAMLGLESTETVFIPDFSLQDLQNVPHNLAEWQGKILVINFWATWCPPCRKEIPDLIDLQNKYFDKGVRIVGIALDDKDAVESYGQSTKINYTILLGGREGISLAHQLGNSLDTIPYTAIINKNGKIVYRHRGEIEKETIEASIDSVLAQ